VTARTRARVWFVGAGPGAADLITLRGARAIAEADVVVWASSLVHEDILAHASPTALIVDSASLPLEGVREIFERAVAEDLVVARVHTGDPSLWGAVQEQREICDALDLPHETVPGVSAFSAVAARADRELTAPAISQSVILTRLEGGRTPMPSTETVRGFAAHGTTMALYLSVARAERLQSELLAGGYPPDTPCVVAHAATWPQELLVRCELSRLAAICLEHDLHKHTLVLVGPALAADGARSLLYHPGFAHGCRPADPDAPLPDARPGAQPDARPGEPNGGPDRSPNGEGTSAE
jgi:precorrin-4/cobalt-precorrin-4 C11-methyltransferase